MKKALVCGVNGQDGSYLARLLLDKGYEVWGTTRNPQAPQGNLAALSVQHSVRLLHMAPTDFRSVLEAVERSAPDEIYYLAGQSSVGLSFEQPAQTMESFAAGILNILEVLRSRKSAARLYNASSSECFGDTRGQAANEQTPFSPRSPYAVAKAAAHWMVINYRESFGLYACNGILFNHESPLRPASFVTQKVIQAAGRIGRGSQERLVLGRLDIWRDWGWAPEYVDAMWRMLQQDEAQDFVIATGKSQSLEEFVRLAFAGFDLDWRDHVTQSAEFLRPSDIDYSCGNPARAQALLGWASQADLNSIVRAMAAAVRTEDTRHPATQLAHQTASIHP